MTALCAFAVAVSHAEQPPRSASLWLRGSYSNSIKNGGVGIGVGVVRRSEDLSTVALVIEVAALRPVKLRASPGLRALSGDQALFELAASAEPWPIDSSVGARIRGSTIHSSRMTFPFTEAQIGMLLAADRPSLQVMHAEGRAELRLSNGETEDLAAFLRQP